jgi:hypothetical protein
VRGIERKTADNLHDWRVPRSRNGTFESAYCRCCGIVVSNFFLFDTIETSPPSATIMRRPLSTARFPSSRSYFAHISNEQEPKFKSFLLIQGGMQRIALC